MRRRQDPTHGCYNHYKISIPQHAPLATTSFLYNVAILYSNSTFLIIIQSFLNYFIFSEKVGNTIFIIHQFILMIISVSLIYIYVRMLKQYPRIIPNLDSFILLFMMRYYCIIISYIVITYLR